MTEMLFPFITPGDGEHMATLIIPVHQWLSANQRVHPMVRAKETRIFRNQASKIATRAGLPGLGLGYVDIDFVPGGKSALRHDPGNLFNTCKAAQDGLVDAKVLAGDTRKHVRKLTLWSAVPAEREQLTIVLYAVPVA